MEVVNALGRRKAAVARVFVCEGSGVSYDKQQESLAVYFPSFNTSIHCQSNRLTKLGVAEKV